MARLQGLLLFFALLVAVYGAATPSYRPKYCKAHHSAVKKINHAFAYPKEFCRWYNSAKRTHGPLTALPAANTIAGCECILQKAASKVPTDFSTPDDFAPSCDTHLKKKLAGITYKQPKNFCKFWGNGAGTHFHKISPFAKQGLTNMDVYDACACYNLFPAASTTSESPAATTTGEVGPTDVATTTDANTMGATGTAAATTPADTAATTPSATGDVTATPTSDATSIPATTGDVTTTTPPATFTDATTNSQTTSSAS